MQIPFVSSVIYYYKVFRHHAGKKLYLLTATIILAGLTEGLGISLVVPMLTHASAAGRGDDVVSIYFYKTLVLLQIEPTFNIILASIAFAFLIKAVILVIQEALSARISASLTRDMRSQMVSAYTNMKYRHYLDIKIGYLNNIVTTEVDRAVGAFSTYTLCIVALIYIAVYSAASLVISWQATLLALASGILLVYSFKFLNDLSKRYSRLVSEKNGSIQQFLIQIIHYFKYLKATNSFKEIKSKLNGEINSLANYAFKLSLFSGILRSLKEPFVIILLVGLIFFQISVLGKTFAAIMAIIMLFYLVMTKLFMLQYTWQKFNAVVGGIEAFKTTYDEVWRNREAKYGKDVKRFKTAIELRDVNFSFGNRRVLSSIHMTVPRNRITAIVGESGSGKSTLADLITGLLRPESGEIYFDDIAYGEIKLESMRRMIGYVTQDNVMFQDSIANNISLWSGNGDLLCQGKVDKAAHSAYCYEFVKDTSSGYHTLIGDRGIKLSGGQRQRLSIARELFKEPEILIFDEATSSLDSESESFIQKSIDALKGNKTIVVIAHRLATIKNCDYIYVMHKGRISEEGTYDDLYRGNTRFKMMCEAQQL